MDSSYPFAPKFHNHPHERTHMWEIAVFLLCIEKQAVVVLFGIEVVGVFFFLARRQWAGMEWISPATET